MWTNISRLDSGDTRVSKYVFETGNAVAEMVLYRYPTYEERTVICCSTQSGCPVGCQFCGAGNAFVRSLTAEEIISQVEYAFQDRKITPSQVKKLQIMFMSMGEPLLNFTALRVAIMALYQLYPNAALLVSTSAPRVGVDYELFRLLSLLIPTVGLQFSVHESTDEKRNALIPFRAKLSLQEIAAEGEAWASATGRMPFFNYCVHEANASAEDADRLLQLFIPHIWQATLSVICARDEHVSDATRRQRNLVEMFAGMLTRRGFSTRVFDPAGQDDIGGGCGQLWFVQQWMRTHPDFVRPSIGKERKVVWQG